MNIGGRSIGAGEPVYVIAEIGVNHDGSVERALELTDAAAAAGADAVKLQYFETDRLMSKAAKLAAYQRAAGETDPIEMLRRLELSLDECARVIERAHALGVHAIVTLFSLETVEPGLALPWDAIKTASPDVVNRPLLEVLAADGRPMVVSTGASTLGEVVRTVGPSGWLAEARDRLAVLQCVSSYPAPDAGLGGIRAIADATGLPTGYSDHTEPVETGRNAVGVWAVLLERHLTYDRHAVGPDHAASLEAADFASYVNAAHGGLPAHGRTAASKGVLPCEEDVRAVSRQSVVATRAVRTGEVLTRDILTVKRPCDGTMPAADLEAIIGQRCGVDVGADEPLPIDAVDVHLPGRVSFAEAEPAN